MVGVASVERWETPPFEPWIPEEFWPQSIYPEAKSVVVIGLPISLPVLETSPSIWYRELYRTVNTLLDQYTYRLSNYLCESGHPSVFVPRDGYANIEALLKNPIALSVLPNSGMESGKGCGDSGGTKNPSSGLLGRVKAHCRGLTLMRLYGFEPRQDKDQAGTVGTDTTRR